MNFHNYFRFFYNKLGLNSRGLSYLFGAIFLLVSLGLEAYEVRFEGVNDPEVLKLVQSVC